MELNICCLCLKNDIELIDMFSEQGARLQIANILAEHFWFEVKLDSAYEKSICTTCWWKVENFHVFYKHVKENHTKFYDSIDEPQTTIKFADEFDLFEIVDDSEIIESQEDFRIAPPLEKRRREPFKSSTQVLEEDEKIKQYFKLECDLCSAKFNEYIEMRPHYRSEHQKDGYLVCCNKKFRHKVRMLEHVQQHLNPDTFKCEPCKKTFLSKSGLLDHLDSHVPETERKYKCSNCPKRFVKKFQLNQHMIYHTSDEDKHFKCDQCIYIATTNSILQSHIRKVHNGSDEILCYVCAKPFRSKYFFQKHFELEHTDAQLKVQCQLCKMWLKHERSLRSHMVRHSDANKQFFCDICGKQSPNRNALSRHKQYAHNKTKVKDVMTCSVNETINAVEQDS